jgi:hypothetical protein
MQYSVQGSGGSLSLILVVRVEEHVHNLGFARQRAYILRDLRESGAA